MTERTKPPAWFAEVCAWPGVTTGPHRFGGTEFLVNGKEIGHTHGFSLVDILLPRGGAGRSDRTRESVPAPYPSGIELGVGACHR